MTSFDPDSHTHTLRVQVPQYSVYIPTAITTVPSIASMHTPYLGTLDP